MFWNISADKKDWVNKQISGMTLDEKIGQIVSERNSDFMQVSDRREWLRKYPVGSMFVGTEIINADEESQDSVKDCIAALRNTCRIPVLLCGDFEHGIGCQVSGFTRLPDLMALGATQNHDLAYEYGRVIAEEARSLGIRWGLGPVADLNTNHMNPVTNTRSLTDNPDYCIKMLSALIRGMQENGMAACTKHFPGDGTDTRNQHVVTSLNMLSKTDWDKLHGKVFKGLIDAGTASIMIGHMGFPDFEAIDASKQKFRPATASKKIMTDLLRNELGFKGIILTDALCMNGFVSWGDYEDRMLASFNGGTDIFLWPETPRFFELMKAALKDGRASMERLEESVYRVMSFKAWLGLDKPETGRYELTFADSAKNESISRQVAEQSLTLLRNQKGSIPLQLSANAELLMLAIPGTEIAMKPIEYFKRDFEERCFKVTLLPFSEYDQVMDIEKFACVFLICNSRPLYVEYQTYNNYGFWGFMQDKKIKKRIVISFGTPYFLYEVVETETYFNVYSDCEESWNAAVKALFGEIPFAGHSPVSLKHCICFGEGLAHS